MAGVSLSLAERIDALLPQTQCRRCGYDGCRPYAQAIGDGTADINRCPPGGEATIVRLADLLGQRPIPPDPSCGPPTPFAIAGIDEMTCIGCTLCIAACPVDAIVGAAKLMHTVLADRCTGCALCLPACPVACIAMRPSGRDWTQNDAQAARERYGERNARLAAMPRLGRRAEPPRSTRAARRAAVAAALERARARRARGGGAVP